jgi:hypothetical protein
MDGNLFNPDNGRGWEFVNVIGVDGQPSNALRFRNYFYQGYEAGRCNYYKCI